MQHLRRLFFKKNQLVINIIGLLLVNTGLHSINVKAYKDSYTIFKPEKQYLSAIHGIPFYYTIAPGIYSVKFQEQETATYKLCRQLFYSPDEQFIFGPTRLNTVIPPLTGKIIAEIIELLDDHKLLEQINHEYLAQKIMLIIQQDQISLNKVNDEINRTIFPKLLSITTKANIPRNLFKKKLTQLTIQECKYLEEIILEKSNQQNTIKELFSRLITLNDESKRLKKNLWFKPYKNLEHPNIKKFIHNLILSCYESGLFKEKCSRCIYNTYTPYRLLQAFLFSKYADANELTNYTQTLNKHHEKNQDSNQNKLSLEKIIISEFSLTHLPEIDDHKEATCTIKDSQQKILKKGSLRDCTENVIRHLIHLLVYDSETDTFDSEKLKKFLGTGKVINQKLLAYFKKFPNPTAANAEYFSNSNNGHDEWVNITSNIKGVGYLQAYNVTTNKQKTGLFMHESIFSACPPHTDNLSLENNTFKPAEATSYLYEAQASIRNIIVVLNELLGLELFDIKNKELYQEFFQNKPGFLSKKFVEYYWQELCNKCNWEFTLWGNEDTHSDIIIMHNKNTKNATPVSLKLRNNVHAQIKPKLQKKSLPKPETMAPLDELTYELMLHQREPKYILKIIKNIQNNSILSDDQLNQLTCDASMAYYHALTSNNIPYDDLTELFEDNKLLTIPALISSLNKIKQLAPDLFLTICVNLENAKREKVIKSIDLDNPLWLNSLQATQDSHIPSTIIKNNQDFNSSEVKHALNNPYVRTRTIIEALSSNNNVIQQHFFTHQSLLIERFMTEVSNEKTRLMQDSSLEMALQYSDILSSESITKITHHPLFKAKTLLFSLVSFIPKRDIITKCIKLLPVNQYHLIKELKQDFDTAQPFEQMRIISSILKLEPFLPEEWVTTIIFHKKFAVEHIISRLHLIPDHTPDTPTIISKYESHFREKFIKEINEATLEKKHTNFLTPILKQHKKFSSNFLKEIISIIPISKEQT